MSKFVTRTLTLAALSLTLVAAPVITAQAAPESNPAPPPPKAAKMPADPKATGTGGDDRAMPRPEKPKKNKSSEVRPSQDTAFTDGYRAAYSTIYDRHDYKTAIEQLKALGHDDMAAVANLLGYSYRQLGDYKVSQVWYERALKADPNHVKTWQYYGLWQVEQGNREAAQYHLSKIAQIAGTTSEEYRSLAAALEMKPGNSLVY